MNTAPPDPSASNPAARPSPRLRNRAILPVSALAVLAGAMYLADPAPGAGLVPLWTLDWSEAVDAESPLPEGWSLGDPSGVRLVEAPDDASRHVVAIDGHADSPIRLDGPMRRAIPARGAYFVEVEAGYEGSDRATAFFFTVGQPSFLDFRIGAGRAFLCDLSGTPAAVGDWLPGGMQTVRIRVDADESRVTDIWIGGQKIATFEGYEFLRAARAGQPPAFRLFGTTPFEGTVYLGRISVLADRPDPGPYHEEVEVRRDERIPAFDVETDASFPLAIDAERLGRPGVRAAPIYFSDIQLAGLPIMIAENPRAAVSWENLRSEVEAILRAGGISGGTRPYIYGLNSALVRLGFVYLLTGDPVLGGYLRTLILDALDRPPEFWVHAELRPFNPARPVGGLETAHLSQSVALAVNWGCDLFDDEEFERLCRTLREKGLGPCLRWLETPRASNWTAVIASESFTVARFLGDEEAMDRTRTVMLDYLDLVEEDGSYGEQIGYFSYPIRTLSRGFVAMGLDEAARHIRTRGLRHSLRWMAYHYYFDQPEGSDLFGPGKLNFGDEDMGGRPGESLLHFLAHAAEDPLGLWLIDRYWADDEPANWFTLALWGATLDRDLAAAGPGGLGMPTVAAFDTGVGVIRSGWEPNGIVLGFRSGGAARTGYAHDRPNRNAIALYAYGEQLLVNPGRASYRSPVRQTWDMRTASHNTVTFDGENQHARPEARILASGSAGALDYLVSEAAPSYAHGPDRVRRRILFVRDPGYFVVWDEIRSSEQRRAEWNLHLANHDGEGELDGPSAAGILSFRRPRAGIRFWVEADRRTEIVLGDGIMHTGYSYYAGGPNEGDWGSSRRVVVRTAEREGDVSFFSVLFPFRAEAEPVGLAIERTDDTIAVRLVGGEDRFRLRASDEAGLDSEIEFHRAGDAGTALRETLRIPLPAD